MRRALDQYGGRKGAAILAFSAYSLHPFNQEPNISFLTFSLKNSIDNLLWARHNVGLLAFFAP